LVVLSQLHILAAIMNTFVVVSASLALTSSGRRAKFPSEEMPDTGIAAESLSKLLLSISPAFAELRPLAKQSRVNVQHNIFNTQRSETPLMRGGAIPIEKRTDFPVVVGIASLLCLISGMVNIISFLVMGIPCTHHTGSATHIGRLVGTTTAFGDLTPGAAALSILVLVATYVAGAGAAGFAKCNGENAFAGKTSWGLMASALIVAAGVALRQATGLVTPTMALWSFSQGLQNAISTSAAAFVGFPVRTTHVTGAATDLGSGLGQWLSAKMAGTSAPSLRKPIVFGSSIFFFGLGGYIARYLVPIYGALSGLVPAVLLAVLSLGRPFFKTVSE
jgi:uncharacterized membrane protein YoaK (UPF0700 family)